MLEQVSNSVKFLAFYTASKQGKTGLTVTVDIYNPSGSQIVTAGSATALGGGLYSYTLSTNNSAEGEYAAIFKTTDSTVDAQHIPSLWVLGRAGVENLDASVSSRSTLTAAQVNAEADTALSDVGLTTTITGRIDQAISTRLAGSAYTAPTTAPTAAAVASAVRTELTEISNLDASVSSRLAAASYTAPANSDISSIKSKTDNLPASPAAVSDIPTTAQISAAVEGSLLNEADGQQILNAIVGAIGNQNLSEVSLVAAVRADLERTGGKLDSIPTTTAPTAAQNASAVWSASAKVITGGVVDTLTNAPASVTPSDIWSYNARTLTSASGPTAAEIRQEIDANSAKLDVAISTRLAGSAYTAPANSDVAAIKAKTDNLPSDPADQSLVEAAISSISIPSVPSAASVASAVRAELTEISNLDVSVSSRLAGSSYSAPSTPPTASAIASAVWAAADKTGYSLTSSERTAIATAVETSILNEADGQQILNAIVGAIGNQNVDQVALVAAIRSDLERNGGKLINLDAAISSRLAAADYTAPTSAPSAASVASAVWGAATKEITGGTVTTLTNSPDVPTEAEIASQVRTELSLELGRIDAAISSRLAPSGTLATVTTLTNAPTVPTAAAIADEVRVELATELARIDAPISGAGNAPSAATVATAVRSELSTELARVDQNISSRLASSAYTAAPTTAQISAAVEGSLLNEADGQQILNAIVGAIGNQNLSEVSLVAAVRADLERTGGKLDSIPTTAAPTAAENASAVWGASAKVITGGVVDTLTNAPANGPTAAQIRQELDNNSTQLSAIKSKTDALPSDPADQSLLEAAIAGVTAPSAATVASAVRSELSSELAKVSALNTERLANVATTAIVGNLIAQANS
jgi:hypothetical protein